MVRNCQLSDLIYLTASRVSPCRCVCLRARFFPRLPLVPLFSFVENAFDSFETSWLLVEKKKWHELGQVEMNPSMSQRIRAETSLVCISTWSVHFKDIDSAWVHLSPPSMNVQTGCWSNILFLPKRNQIFNIGKVKIETLCNENTDNDIFFSVYRTFWVTNTKKCERTLFNAIVDRT